jgi:hypothetical protein
MKINNLDTCCEQVGRREGRTTNVLHNSNTKMATAEIPVDLGQYTEIIVGQKHAYVILSNEENTYD